MLILFFGASCVGKTTIMRELACRHGWEFIPTYMTRDNRDNEDEKHHIDRVRFLEMSEKNMFLSVNERYFDLYGTLKSDVENAVRSTSYHMLDFPIWNRKKYFRDYLHVGIIVFPTNRDQLLKHISSADRINRLDMILEEHDEKQSMYFEHLETSNTIRVDNISGDVRGTANKIVELMGQLVL